jgi:hypothetical protein
MRTVHLLALILSLATLAGVLWEAFETMILPRTVTRRLRFTRVYFTLTWTQWRSIARRMRTERRRERFLAVFGPLSLLGLVSLWAIGLVIGFAGLQWAAGSQLRPLGTTGPFIEDLYMSGTTLFTLGLGDLQPASPAARLITVAEAGTGFAFLAIVIAYFPVLYQSFSRREAQLTLLDAWAGSPPAAIEILRRLAAADALDALQPFLKDWEYWCSDLLESHISYPVVAFFRSQHQRQSWVSALATILDLSALVEVGIDGIPTWQAHATFAIARHAAVDLSQVLRTSSSPDASRPIGSDHTELLQGLSQIGLALTRPSDAEQQLLRLRRSYEPYVSALAQALVVEIPRWSHARPVVDNWQVGPRGAGEAHL